MILLGTEMRAGTETKKIDKSNKTSAEESGERSADQIPRRNKRGNAETEKIGRTIRARLVIQKRRSCQ